MRLRVLAVTAAAIVFLIAGVVPMYAQLARRSRKVIGRTIRAHGKMVRG